MEEYSSDVVFSSSASLSTSNSSNSIENKKLWDIWKHRIREYFSSSFSSTRSSASKIINDYKYSLSATKASLILVFIFLCTLAFATFWSSTCHLFRYGINSMQFSYSMLYNIDSLINTYPKREEHILKCTSSNMTLTCPSNYPPEPNSPGPVSPSNRTCPAYFRWIHEDLKIWKRNGIDKHLVESAKEYAHFRLIIVNGTAYVHNITKSWQHRDIFVIWGILQLVKLYPGRLPDVDLMFHCNDFNQISKDKYPGEQSAFAPPLFHFNGNASTYDIVFPDWTFWGWPEIGMRPWVVLSKELEKGNSIKKWTARKQHAYWMGTMYNGLQRSKLIECASVKNWSALIENQTWAYKGGVKVGSKNSDVSKQCHHRYKIYVDGLTWSVSKKYILACDSMTLFIEPVNYDFFTRGLIPMKHYWPISSRGSNLCKSIKFAVQWGNNNTHKAQEIGKEGSEYILKHLRMKDVYDYMFHLLNEYSKLLNYKPTVPEGAEQLCTETFACSPMGRETDLKMMGLIDGPSEDGPCTLPPPYDPETLETIELQKAKMKEVVDMWVNATHFSPNI